MELLPGVGKTHLAIVLGISAIENKYSTYFISCHQLIQNLLKANHENRLDERLKQYAKYKVLIIDEIGYLPTSLEGANLFFQLIARRYEKHSTIFTTNKNFGEWQDIFQDNTISAAILDRILLDQLRSMTGQLESANARLDDNNRQIELLTEQIRLMNQRHFGKKAERFQKKDLPEPTIEEVTISSYRRSKSKGKRKRI